jgi:hypothetical protein
VVMGVDVVVKMNAGTFYFSASESGTEISIARY